MNSCRKHGSCRNFCYQKTPGQSGSSVKVYRRVPIVFYIMNLRSAYCKNRKESMTDTHTLSHTTWNCKYHVVFAPKYRRKIFYGEKRAEIGAILRQLCKWKGVNILEAEVCPDHVHMLVEIPPKYSVSQFMGYLKGKSSLMIYEKWGNMKYKYRNREFWCGSLTVQKNDQFQFSA